MPISVVRFMDNHRCEWDSFVSQSINGTFLHNRTFFDCNPANAIDDHSLMFYSGHRLLALLPATLSNQELGMTFHSHNRSTYGGFLFNKHVGILDAVEIVSVLVQYLRSIGVKAVIIRNPFRILYDQISDEFEYAMWYHGFNVASREAEVYIDLVRSIELIRMGYSDTTRRNVNRAAKSVEVSINEQGVLDDFWSILEDNLASKHDTRPTHSRQSIGALIDTFGNDKIKLCVARVDGKVVAGCVLFVPRRRVLHAQYIALDYKFQSLRPLNALFDTIILWGNSNGFQILNLGTANEGGRIINAGLFHFKEGFGGRSVLRETHQFHLND